MPEALQKERDLEESLDRDRARAGLPAIPAWIPLIVLLVALLRFALRSAKPIGDPDTWWHLRLGQEFRGGWSFGDPGQLSPFATVPWVATQWSLELVASLGEDAFGLKFIPWMAGLAVLLLGGVLFSIARSRVSLLPASLVTVVALFGASGSLTPRPQVASFVLLAIVTATWLRAAQDLRPRWWLIPLTWVWAVTHGMWFTGVIVGVAVVLGLAVARDAHRPELIRLLAIPLLSVAAAALTPAGPALFLAPLKVNSMGQFVEEFQAPEFTHPAVAATGAMLTMVLLTWALGSRRPRLPEVFVLMVAAVWTVYAYRTVALGAVMTAPLLADAVGKWIQEGRYIRPSTRELTFLASGIAVCLVVVTWTVGRYSTATDPEVFPEALASELQNLPEGTIVFNEYGLGGWLEWEHRNVVPVVDPMLDAYSLEHVKQVVAANHLVEGWEDFLAETTASYALLRQEAPLATELRDHMGWSEQGIDRRAGYVLMRRPDDVRSPIR